MGPVFDKFSANVAVDGSIVNLGLWDTAGQEDYSRLRPLSYRGADIFLLAFSLISRASYENVLKKWMPELRRFAPDVPVVLVGIKLDLHDDKGYLANPMNSNAIMYAQREELRKQIGATAYVECSSKIQQNVKVVFDTATKAVIQPPRRKEVAATRQKRHKSSNYLLTTSNLNPNILSNNSLSIVSDKKSRRGRKRKTSSLVSNVLSSNSLSIVSDNKNRRGRKRNTSSSIPNALLSNNLSILSDNKIRWGRKIKSSEPVLKSYKSVTKNKLSQNKIKSKVLKRALRSASVPRAKGSASRFTSHNIRVAQS